MLAFDTDGDLYGRGDAARGKLCTRSDHVATDIHTIEYIPLYTICHTYIHNTLDSSTCTGNGHVQYRYFVYTCAPYGLEINAYIFTLHARHYTSSCFVSYVCKKILKLQSIVPVNSYLRSLIDKKKQKTIE